MGSGIFRSFKSADRAFVDLSGKRIYLGRYGTQESRDRYDLAIAEWIARGRREAVPPTAPAAPEAGPTVSTIVAAFWNHCQSYYVDPDGKTVGFDDVFTRIDKCRAHYAKNGLGADYIDQFIR